MPTALLSAHDKTGVAEFATELNHFGWSILASSGTAKHIKELSGISVTDIATIVGEPILGHRVVTLSRQIHAGLLAKDTPEDNAELERIGMSRIDLVYVSLYPLAEAIAKPDRTLKSVFEMTDIGGPAMMMAAIKGQRLVLSRPQDLATIYHDLRDGDWQSIPLRCRYASQAAVLVASYYEQLVSILEEVGQLPT